MGVSTIKFSQFNAVNLANTTNFLVGINSLSGGNNIYSSTPTIWTTAGRPSPPFAGLLGFNSTIEAYEWYNGTQWVQPMGEVDAGIQNQLAWYAVTGTVISGLATANNGVLVTSSGGVPSISSTLPSGLTIPSPIIIGSNGFNVATFADAASSTDYFQFIAGANNAANIRILSSASTASFSILSKGGTVVIGSETTTTIPLEIATGTNLGFQFSIPTCTGLHTLLFPDANVTLVGGTMTVELAGDSGTATPTSSGVITVSGGSTGLTTSGSSNTLSLGGLLNPTFGGTGISNPTAHGIMVAEGSSAMTSIVLGAGQLLIGTTSGDPTAAAINSGTSVLVQNSSGSITVGLAAIASHDILSNITSGSAAPVANTLTATIDAAIGSTQGDILYRNSTVWTVLAPGTSGQLLSTGGAAANPSWVSASATGAITTIDGDSGSITPSSGVVTISGGTTGLTTSGSSATLSLTGTLKLANGGTNASLTASNGGIVYSTASAMGILAGTATANQVLLSGSSTTPAWSTATYPATTTANQLLYSSSNNTIAGLATANSSVLITSSGGIPSLSTTLPSGLAATNLTLTTPVLGTPQSGTLTNCTGLPSGAGILCVSTNSNASAGQLGEYMSSQVSSGSPVSLTSVTTANLTSLSLTAGDWDVYYNAIYFPASTTTLTRVFSGLTSTSATEPGINDQSSVIQTTAITGDGANVFYSTTGSTRITLASTTTYYCVVQATFAVSTCTAFGWMWARRRR